MKIDVTTRDRLARPVIAAYWLLLVAGLGIYTFAVRGPATQALWIGAIAGSVLGHALALRNLRLWFVCVILAGAGYIGLFVSPGGLHATTFWLAFVPGTLCAYASLADRWSLAATWFPAVTWMLTILDRTPGTHALDGLAVGLLGVLAVGVVVFLYVRETRRVRLWQTTGATPLAPVVRTSVLTEAPGAAMAKTAWSLAMTAGAFAMTVWLAPRLWQLEQFHQHELIAKPGHGGAGLAMGDPLPCCQDCIKPSTRVGEYMDLGRGHDALPVPGVDCRACPDPEPSGGGGGGGVITPYYPTGDYYVSGGGVGGGDGVGGGGGGVGDGVGGGLGDGVGGGVGGSPELPWVDPQGHVVPKPDTTPPVVAGTVTTKPAPAPVVIDRPRPLEPSPSPAALPLPLPLPSQSTTTTTTASTTTSTSSSGATPASPRTSMSSSSSNGGLESAPETPSRLLEVLVWLIVGALSARVIALLLRPLRRAVVLRHLRRPFWDETVDQRVSNAWQLALIGLRDAGYRFGGVESPREFAQRVGVAGLDRCATILERARYGVAIDGDDLADMLVTADHVYGGARAKIGGLARVASQVRWPLA